MQDAASPLMEQLIFFHDHAILVLVLIVRLVSYAAFTLIRGSFSSRYLLECQEIEAV